METQGENTITTRNPQWGFHGTLVQAGARDAADQFNEAAHALLSRFAISADEARDVLDSRLGRHVADQRRLNERAGVLITRLCRSPKWVQEIWSMVRVVRARTGIDL